MNGIKKLKILTFNWHTPYIESLAKTGHQFDIVNFNNSTDGSVGWNFSQRPLPLNINFISSASELFEKLKNKFYDLSICFTELELQVINEFTYLPVIFFALNSLSVIAESQDDKFIFKEQVLNFLSKRKSIFATPSKLKLKDWGIDGLIIASGIDVNDYYSYTGEIDSILTVGNLIKERKFIFDYNSLMEISKDFPYRIVGYNPQIKNSRKSKNWEELKRFYQKNRVYLHSTLNNMEDGFNLSLLEAMASGMPIVSTYNKSSPIINGENGFISDDINYLREKIKLLLNDKNLALEFGKKAKDTVTKDFSIKSFIDNWNKAFYLSLD